tara:strand:+ start:417 stop:1304 length:888 start_codon:yes stop_codon:yes gene_type:complete
MNKVYIANIFNKSFTLLSRFLDYNRLFRNKPRLFIFSLHSTNKADFDKYKILLSQIHTIAPFLNPKDINAYFSGKYGNSPRSLLTLDDGFKDNYEFATQILNPLNIKAIFFIIPYYLENNYNSVEFLAALYPEHKPTPLGLDINLDKYHHLGLKEVENLYDFGHTIGIHGYNHESSTSISTKHLSELTTRSINIIEKYLNNIEHYCYPFGSYKDFSHTTNSLLKSKFRFVHTGIRGVNSTKEYNNGILKRHPISGHGSDLCYKPYDFENVFFFAFNPLSQIPVSTYHKLKSLFNF